MTVKPHVLGPNTISTNNFPRLQVHNSNPIKCSHKCAVKDDSLTLWPSLGKIVNVTMQQTKKRSRLKNIVDAANEYLGTKDMSVEVLHELLVPSDGLSRYSD